MGGLVPPWAWGIPVGMLGTLVMDVSGALFKLVGAGTGCPPALFARWLGHMFQGRFSHPDIALAVDVAPPMGVVIAVHYAIGATLGVGFALLAQSWAARPIPLVVPILYGVATTVFAAGWMFPAMGWGIAGLDAPPELNVLRTTLFKHLMFGVGLAGAWHWLGRSG